LEACSGSNKGCIDIVGFRGMRLQLLQAHECADAQEVLS
jgi:hypothetical protein